MAKAAVKGASSQAPTANSGKSEEKSQNKEPQAADKVEKKHLDEKGPEVVVPLAAASMKQAHETPPPGLVEDTRAMAQAGREDQTQVALHGDNLHLKGKFEQRPTDESHEAHTEKKKESWKAGEKTKVVLSTMDTVESGSADTSLQAELCPVESTINQAVPVKELAVDANNEAVQDLTQVQVGSINKAIQRLVFCKFPLI